MITLKCLKISHYSASDSAMDPWIAPSFFKNRVFFLRICYENANKGL
jgi:hypothetical protein